MHDQRGWGALAPAGWMLLAALAAGCEGGKSCTAIGCGAAFEVSFERPSGWTTGAYDFDVEADGQWGSCTARLPFPAANFAIGCEGRADWTLGLSGGAQPANHGFTGVTFLSARPATVSVSVSQDGRAIGSGQFQPTYTDTWPNGRACDATPCRTAPAAVLTLQ